MNGEWTWPVRHCDVKEIKDAISNGFDLPNINAAEINSTEQIVELKLLWNVLGCSGAITAVLTGQAKEIVDSTKTQITVTREWQNLRVEEVGLLVLGDPAKATWTKPPIQVEKVLVPSVDRCTLRVAAPVQYRQHFFQELQDKPKHIVTEIAQMTRQVKAAQLTGGNWTEQEVDKQTLIVGFLKLSREIAEDLVQASGTKGIFMNIFDNLTRILGRWRDPHLPD